MSPNSLTTTAVSRRLGLRKSALISVVLPLPKKPVRTVIGMRCRGSPIVSDAAGVQIRASSAAVYRGYELRAAGIVLRLGSGAGLRLNKEMGSWEESRGASHTRCSLQPTAQKKSLPRVTAREAALVTRSMHQCHDELRQGAALLERRRASLQQQLLGGRVRRLLSIVHVHDPAPRGLRVHDHVAQVVVHVLQTVGCRT